MKIVFFTQEDPFYVKVFFEEFFERFAHPHEIKAIVISRPFGKNSLIALARQMLSFYGPADFLYMGVRWAFYKSMSKARPGLGSLGLKLKPSTIKQLAPNGTKVIERSDLNSPDFIEIIRQYDADLFISVASPIIFKNDVIGTPKLDCINIHSGPLPKYRGMMPVFWQLYHREKTAGITIHRIDSGIDTGDILAQGHVAIDPRETLQDVIFKTKREGARMMLEVIEDFRHGRVLYRRMQGEGSYFSFPSSDHVAKLKASGRKLL